MVIEDTDKSEQWVHEEPMALINKISGKKQRIDTEQKGELKRKMITEEKQMMILFIVRTKDFSKLLVIRFGEKRYRKMKI